MRGLKVKEGSKEKRLAGTFFFSRKHTKRCITGYFFATLAYQLARNFPSIRSDVNKTILDNPALLDPDTSLRDQMEALFLQPLRWLQLRLRECSPLVFVIDALDECTSESLEEDASKSELADLISLLGEALCDPGLPITHILLTSRSEEHIRKAMHAAEMRPLLCEIPVKMSGEGIATTISLDGIDVDNDICIFLQHSFTELGSRHPDFPQPSGDPLARLASRAGRRFIVASTMVKFIDDRPNDPRDRLKLMLDLTSELLPGTEVYKLYDRILSTCADPTLAYLLLSAVTALADPLPMAQISKLLGPGEGTDVERVLVQLRSIIDVPMDTNLPVNIYHSSIRDYVSDPSNSSIPGVQRITPPHSLLARSCLRLLVQDIPESMALLNALSELTKHSQAMEPQDPKKLKHTLAFIVQPLEPLQVLITLLWLRGHRSSKLQFWLETRDGRAWLRTDGVRDWLRTLVGKDWLATEGGKDWLLTQCGNDWMQTRGGRDWMKTWGGRDWIRTEDGQNWLQTGVGRGWLQTQGGRDWMKTEDGQEWQQIWDGVDWMKTWGGRDWMRAKDGQDWLQTRDGRGWLQTNVGRDWVTTKDGHGWLQIRGGRGWLQTNGGRDWAKTKDGHDWLQTRGGRGWLQTNDGRDWVKTEDGQDWLQTERGRKLLLSHTLDTPWIFSLPPHQSVSPPSPQSSSLSPQSSSLFPLQPSLLFPQPSSSSPQPPLSLSHGMRDLQTPHGRDWLQSQEGRDWLQIWQGQDWLQSQGGRDWLQTWGMWDWLQTEGGKGWLQTPGGREWLKTLGGREWLNTQGGKDWLQTQEGNDWLWSWAARDWLDTRGGKDWLQTQGGKDWLQTPGGRDWLQTKGWPEWLKTPGGREWLLTPGGREWLQSRRGRDWLRAPGGRDWLQSPYGQTWRLTTHWVTIEEFSSTMEATREFIVVPDSPLQPALQVIQQFKSLPDFLTSPASLALRHQDNSTSALPYLQPYKDIIHAITAFSSFAYDAREQSRSTSEALNYACQNWAVHLSRAPNPWDERLVPIFETFWTRNLLSWLERQWCLKGLRSCLTILSEGEKLAQEHLQASR